MDEVAKKPSKYKVLYVITKSNFGGAQRYVYDCALAASKNYDVAVAFGGTGARGASPGLLEDRLARAGIRTVRITHFMRNVSLYDDIRAFFELVRIVRTERPHILHVTSSKAGGLGALAGRVVGVPRIVFTSHGLVYDESWRPFWQRALLYLFTWCTMLLAHVSIYISKETYERARRMPFMRNRVYLIYNGIMRPEFLTRDDARRTLAGDSASRTVWIGTIAELHPNKNLALLIDAVGILRARGVTVETWLIGDGEERAHLEEHAHALGVAPAVHCTGYIEHAARLLSAFDIFVLPSKKEGLPYVLLEAGMAHLAVVGSNISGINEIIENGVSGELILHDSTALADVLERLVKEPGTCAAYGTALARRVEERFSITRMYDDTRRLYEQP